MLRREADIFISGGGIAGQVAATVFAERGFSVIMADPVPPVTEAGLAGSDLRSTAFLRPARALFEACGLWPVLAPHATPLERLAVIDTTGWPPVVRDRRTFAASEMGEEPFGWNLMNWVVRRELAAYLQGAARITALYGTGFASLVQRTDGVIVRLSDGSQVRAKLAIAADGRMSPLREAAGIGARVTRYGQKALAFTVTHDLPHENVSTEIYNEGGAFTVVPLADVGGKHASAVIWMNFGPRAVDLMAMPVDEFEDVMFARSTGLLGRMRLEGRRSSWPIVTQTAERLTDGRVALVAEAAHALPPIGAQGLNTSLNDIAALIEAVSVSHSDPGAPAVLATYARARRADIAARARVIDLFNRVARSGGAGMQAVRLLGLKAVHDIAPLRRGVMRAGLGPR
jgi:2-octaprenyl-6-methoxyphenol hydroxylase